MASEPVEAEVVEAGDSVLERLRPASNPLTYGLPRVDGHQVGLNEWAAFEAYLMAGGGRGAVAAAAHAAEVSASTIRTWRRSPWWEELFARHVADRQQDLHAGLVSLVDDAIEAGRKILTGELDAEKSGKYATSIASIINMLTKVGQKPLQDTRSVTNVDARTVNNSGTINISRERIEKLGSDDLLKVITGQMELPG